GIYQLTQATNPSIPVEQFSYDAAGNRVGTSVNVVNRLLEDASFTYSYDNNGNLTQKTSRSTGEITTYTYDAEMRLTQASRPGMTAIYKYDPFGRRIEKSVNGTVTRYLYDREDIIARLNSNNQVVAAYSHGPETDEPLSAYQGGQWFFYHRDGLGSVTMMTDVSGAAAQSYNYGSFGNIIGVSNPNLIQPYTFTSREYDEETDLYYYRARYYDARAGRFISADPIGLEGGDSNYFRYVVNNPVNRIDPDGKMGRKPGLIEPAVQVYDAAQCARYQKMYYDALKKCEKECGDSLEGEARYLDKYSSSGLSMSLANFGCVCAKMKLNGKNCKDVFAKCMGLGFGLPVKRPANEVGR
nr:hypothetical protein [Syntrophorhabdaceae bacterium]